MRLVRRARSTSCLERAARRSCSSRSSACWPACRSRSVVSATPRSFCASITRPSAADWSPCRTSTSRPDSSMRSCARCRRSDKLGRESSIVRSRFCAAVRSLRCESTIWFWRSQLARSSRWVLRASRRVTCSPSAVLRDCESCSSIAALRVRTSSISALRVSTTRPSSSARRASPSELRRRSAARDSSWRWRSAHSLSSPTSRRISPERRSISAEMVSCSRSRVLTSDSPSARKVLSDSQRASSAVICSERLASALRPSCRRCFR